MTIRTLSTLLVALMALLPAMASDTGRDKDPDGITLYAVASTSAGDKDVYLGDSVIVTITLYCNTSFSQVKNKSDKDPSVKKARVRKYNRNRRMNQGVGIYQGRRYNAVVAQQFAVTPDETGTITFPAMKYNVELLLQSRNRGYNPFDDFFGRGSTTTKRVERTVESEPITIHVTKRPPKTIRDLQESGATLM